MSQRYLVLTAVGTDRPGLVMDVSQCVYDAGCNLEDSRMAVLAGEFALIVLLSGDTDAVGRMDRACRETLSGKLELRVTLEPTEPRSVQPESLIRRLEIRGTDQPGIVHRVSEVLAKRQVNVASLESRLVHAAFSGTPMFSLVAEIELPDAACLTSVSSDLDEICDELDLACAFEAK